MALTRCGLTPAQRNALRAELTRRARPSGEDWLTPEDAAILDAATEEPGWLGPDVVDLDDPAWDPAGPPPSEEELWLRELPGALQDEYLAAIAAPPSPEVIKAGFLDRSQRRGHGFAAGGVADTLAPGPVLAGLVDDACYSGIRGLTDDELIGVLRAGRRLASWAASVELTAAADLFRRRMAQEAAGEARVAEHAVDEVAAALTLTAHSADRVLNLATALAELPATRSALADGRIDLPRAAVIVDQVGGLAPAHRDAVEERVLTRAPDQTTGQLRRAVQQAVLAVDPTAARLRRERAEREARVERWDEERGTSALAGRDLPRAGVLAADRHITSLARRLKAGGVSGGMDQIRASVFLGLLSGRSFTSPPPAGDAAESASRPDVVAPPAPELTGSVNLTLPLTTWLGLSDAPGEAAGFGPLDGTDSRTLARLLAQRGDASWCLTLTGPDGRPVAHGCARGGPARDGAGSRSPQARAGRGARPPAGPGGRSRADPAAGPATWTFTVTALQTDDCSHPRECASYQPSPTLRHLIEIRNFTCTYPGCRRTAATCDLDHALAYHRGGRTCECDLHPVCRRHHRAKQAPGWRLAHDQPGTLTWITPSGRTYTTRPTQYGA